MINRIIGICDAIICFLVPGIVLLVTHPFITGPSFALTFEWLAVAVIIAISGLFFVFGLVILHGVVTGRYD